MPATAIAPLAKRRKSQLAPLHRGQTAGAPICIILSLSCLPCCAQSQGRPAGVISAPLPSGAGLIEPTAAAARKQNWDCQRIERAIANLITAMEATKERAEKEEEQLAQTLKRMFARLSGPPGAGNAALAEFQETHRDADQLNDLLREKGCTPYAIGVDDPAFPKR